SERAARGRSARRRTVVEHLPQHHAAAAGGGHAVPGRVLHDQRDPGVRRDLLPDEGRSRNGDVRSCALPVQARLRTGHRGICGRDRVRVARGDPDPHRDPALGGQAHGVLRLMSMSAEIRDSAGALPALEQESGRDPRSDRFVFSLWHLVLFPLAFLMLIPMIWMIITSFQKLNETRHFPPSLVPSSIQWQNYTEVLQRAPFARWFLNTLVVTVVVVAGNLLFCSLAGYAFARIKFFGRDVVFILVLATLMVPLHWALVPNSL